jgi:hypothetical protein
VENILAIRGRERENVYNISIVIEKEKRVAIVGPVRFINV